MKIRRRPVDRSYAHHFDLRQGRCRQSHRAGYHSDQASETGQRGHVNEPFDEARADIADITIATGHRTIATGHPYQSDNWRCAAEARAGITIATGRRAQSDGKYTIATGHRHQSDNWRSAGEAHAGITTGHRSAGIAITITIIITTGHRWHWAGEAGQRGHVNAPSGCDR